MRKLTNTLITTALLLILGATIALGQDTDPPTAPVINDLTLQQTIPLSATINIEINGERYQIAVPATINLDAQAALLDAYLKTTTQSQVGVLDWQITDITEYTEEYAYSDFRIYEPSRPGNKLIVITSDTTNLDQEPFERFAYGDLQAIDAEGKRYENEHQLCDAVNPRTTETCILIFDVPTDVTLVGLDLKVTDHKQIFYQPDTE